MVLTKALIRYGTISSVRNIGRHGRIAIFKKYDYKNKFRQRSEVDEAGEFHAKIFIEALKGVKELEKQKIPSGELMDHGLGVYCGMNEYLRDVKTEVLEKLTKVARVIIRDAKPEEVEEALEDLRWYKGLIEERTQDDYET